MLQHKLVDIPEVFDVRRHESLLYIEVRHVRTGIPVAHQNAPCLIATVLYSHTPVVHTQNMYATMLLSHKINSQTFVHFYMNPPLIVVYFFLPPSPPSYWC